MKETNAAELVAALEASNPVATMPAEAPPASSPTPPSVDLASIEPDSLKRAFDPEKFKVNEDGTPRRDAAGRFIAKGIGRKGKKAPTISAKNPAKPELKSYIPTEPPPKPENVGDRAPMEEGAEPPSPPSESMAYAIGAIYAQAGVALSMAILGNDWKPDSKEEFTELARLVGAYLEAKGVEDLAPEWGLILGLGTYAGKRIPRPRTQSRLIMWGDKLKFWFTGRKNARDMEALSKED